MVNVCDARYGHQWFVESYDPQETDRNADVGCNVVALTPVSVVGKEC